jgi:uncharacterized protein (DUF2345 family)
VLLHVIPSAPGHQIDLIIGAANLNGSWTGGGVGKAPAWGRPDLIVAAPSGIGSNTSANLLYCAGATISLVAKDGLIIYIYGKASNSSKPNQETGIQLHAASSNMNTQWTARSVAVHTVVCHAFYLDLRQQVQAL